jgi:hypothetical protein
MVYNLVLTRLERPYRDALAAYGREPQQHENMHRVWQAGKKFFYVHYVVSSLFAGGSPLKFLHAVAIERVRADIQDTLKHHGVEHRLVSLQTMVAYLRNLADSDPDLPQDFKDLLNKSIQQFAGHPWIEEQVDRFLQVATETPEDLHYPEWQESLEECTGG